MISIRALLATAVLVAPAAAQSAHVDERHGFRVTPPGPAWKVEERPGAAGGIELVLTRADREMIAQVVIGIAPAPVGTDPASLVAETLRSLEGRPDSSDVVPASLPVAGDRVPGVAATTKAAGSLEEMRNSDGTWEYMVHGEGPRGAAGPASGAAGRGPVCALALHRAGRLGPEEVGKTLDLFVEHEPGLLRERGKALMHTGPAGQGSHHVLFDLALAAIATRALPASTRERWVGPILEGVLAARSSEGSYRDQHLLGWDYGTAMALLAFENARQD